ncbi:MAG TPA: hypothetical protein VKE69_09810, partial [Planctomycetota bacterium]|nr:hypothetical protein [Planctomycetota bacterium]
MTRRALSLVFALALAHAAAVSAWLSKDRGAPEPDEARTLLAAHRVADAISHPDVGLVRRVASAHPDGEPPLLAAAAAVGELAAPGNPDAPRHAPAAFIAALAFATFALARRAASLVGARCASATGLVAAFLATSCVLVANEGHRLLPHVPIAAGSALVAASWIASDGFARRRASILFGAASAVAILSSEWTALALAAPAIDMVLVAGSVGRARGRLANVALALAVAAIAVAPFFALRAHAPEHVEEATQRVWFHVLAGTMTEKLGVPLVAFGVAGALASAVRVWRARSATPAAWPQAARLVAFGLVPIGLAGASWVPPSYAAAALIPVLATFAAAGLATVAPAPRVLLTSAALASSALAFFASCFDVPSGDGLLARVARELTSRRDPPDPRDRDPMSVLRAIDRDRAGVPADVCVIAPQEEVSGALFEALVAAYFEGIRATAFPDPDAEPMPLLPLPYLRATHLLVARRRGGTDLDEGRVLPCNAGMSRFVASEPPAMRAHFRRVHRAESREGDAPSDRDLVFEVFRRVAPTDDAEIAELIATGTTFARITRETWVEIAYAQFLAGRAVRAREILDA